MERHPEGRNTGAFYDDAGFPLKSGPMPPANALAIDRVAPTLRPPGVGVMRQRWARLLFLHWTVPAEQIRPLLPPGLDLDLFEGRAYLGLVPFTMTGVRPIWLPAVPALSNFHEVNVRTYVHRGGRDPGVWFFSLDAANAVAVRLARWTYRLPYHFASMAMDPPDSVEDPGVVTYESERRWPGPLPARCRLRYEPTGTPAPARVGTLEHFLAERYILYAHAGGRLYTGRVHHAPYPLQTANLLELDETLIAACGLRRPESEPLAHYAREVRVRIHPLRRVVDAPEPR